MNHYWLKNSRVKKLKDYNIIINMTTLETQPDFLKIIVDVDSDIMIIKIRNCSNFPQSWVDSKKKKIIEDDITDMPSFSSIIFDAIELEGNLI